MIRRMMGIRIRTVLMVGTVVAGVAGCSGLGGGAGEPVSSAPASASGTAAVSAGAAASGAVRGRELVARLEEQLRPPMTVQCLAGGGRECAVWLGGAARLAAVDAPNLLDRFPVAGDRAAKVAQLVERVGAAGDAYSRAGCEQVPVFAKGSSCEEAAAGLVVGARLLADELKALWPGGQAA
ncbi:hypothetical protein ACIF6L_34795 [Kitasatospora sp. NPDC086009]|uniref:hypothetical protein n=1 Tax=unclassified Kitasatospora TaxID=2633591 RepID=UPI0037C6AE5B